MLPQTNASHGNDFRRLILRILSRDGKTLSEEGGSEGRGGGVVERMRQIREISSTLPSTQTPNHKTTKKKETHKKTTQ